MSGGAYDYGFYELDKYVGNMKDPELNRLVDDLKELLRSLEWCDSGDTSMSDYLADVKEFKDKWLNNPDKRFKRIVDEEIDSLKRELYVAYGLEDSACYRCTLGRVDDGYTKPPVCHWGHEEGSKECKESREKFK